MNIKKLAVAAIIATTSITAHSAGLEGVSSETYLGMENSVRALVACKAVKQCREAGLVAAKMSARVGDENASYLAQRAWHEGAVAAIKAMRKSGEISEYQETKLLLDMIDVAAKSGITIDISK